ncbi:MAG: proline--tRNA ligase, partial [Candidatus Micrarchaeota archaeon]|nr:proline--tRNA ligase [Candidatus Micrarchaeota archaeon]
AAHSIELKIFFVVLDAAECAREPFLLLISLFIYMKSRKENFSEWYTEVIKEAKLCDLRYNVKGFVVFMPWAVMTMKKMYAIYEQELERTGHKPTWFPALIPESNFHREAQHVEGFTPQVFWVEKAGDSLLEERLALRPTSETAMYQMFSLWIQGKSDLPLKLYHSAQVWRYETKATRPFIRSREFYWIESHDAFATKEEAEAQVAQDMQMSQNVIFEQFGVPFIFFQRPEWDKFPGAVHTYAADCMMPDGRVLQLPSTHFLGQNFAKAFDVKFLDEKGQSQYCWQTCYGPAISRIYAAMISTHGDDFGLVLPFELAPIQVIVIPIPKKGNEELLGQKAKELASFLSNHQIKAEADLSENTPGFKYNQWELQGVPFRIELGQQELESGILTVVRRDNHAKHKVKQEHLVDFIIKQSKDQLADLKKKALSEFESRLAFASSIKELKSLLEEGKLVGVPFCSIEQEGQDCARSIKEETTGDVRGIKFGKKEKSEKGCIACGKQSSAVVYVAKQY